jgi:hypothetical protein
MALGSGLFGSMQIIIMRNKNTNLIKTRPIKDRTLRLQGFGRFSSSSRTDNGLSILFQYPSGARYKVSLAFVLKWCGDSREEDTESAYRKEQVSVVLRTRIFSDGHFVRTYLSDGRRCDIAWDTVLMACEPLYEHYGGLTGESKKLTREWHERCGSFRI